MLHIFYLGALSTPRGNRCDIICRGDRGYRSNTCNTYPEKVGFCDISVIERMCMATFVCALFRTSFASPVEMDHERAAIRTQLINKGVFRLQVDRGNVVTTVVNAYNLNPRLHNLEMKVKFRSERGMDVGGLRRELVNCFWVVLEKMMDGFQEKVPQVLPSSLSDYYQIGCFISHAYVMTGFFPVNHLSSVCAKVILSGIDSGISDKELVLAFNNFVDPFEAAAVQRYVSDKDGQANSLTNSVIIPMLSQFQVFTLPSRENLSSLLVKAARYAKPYFALQELRRGMYEAHPQIWSRCNARLVDRLYSMLTSTVSTVWSMIKEPALNTPSENTTFDYLRRLLHSLSPELLVKFLYFVTGFSVCSMRKIKILFNSAQEGICRRPTSNT